MTRNCNRPFGILRLACIACLATAAWPSGNLLAQARISDRDPLSRRSMIEQLSTAESARSQRSASLSDYGDHYQPPVQTASQGTAAAKAEAVRQANYIRVQSGQMNALAAETVEPNIDTIRRIQDENRSPLEPGASESVQPAAMQSFIERERQAESETTASSSQSQMLLKLIINTAFVLAMAVGFLLVYRVWVMAKKTQTAKGETLKTGLHVRETLSLKNNVTLHVVETAKCQFLVTVDSSGVKSVNSMSTPFESALHQQSLEEMGLQDTISGPNRIAAATQQERTNREAGDVDTVQRDGNIISGRLRSRKARGTRQEQHEGQIVDEETAEMDEKLISMLLQRSREAA